MLMTPVCSLSLDNDVLAWRSLVVSNPMSRCCGILASGIWGGGKEGRWATTMTTTKTGGGCDKPDLGEDSVMLTQWA
jgi:hypothetical protein